MRVNSQIADPILAKLRENPLGVTAKEIAAALGWKTTKASQMMGEMFFLGQLARRHGAPDRRNNEYVYTIKPNAVPTVARGVRVIVPTPLRPMPALALEYARLADELAAVE